MNRNRRISSTPYSTWLCCGNNRGCAIHIRRRSIFVLFSVAIVLFESRVMSFRRRWFVAGGGLESSKVAEWGHVTKIAISRQAQAVHTTEVRRRLRWTFRSLAALRLQGHHECIYAQISWRRSSSKDSAAVRVQTIATTAGQCFSIVEQSHLSISILSSFNRESGDEGRAHRRGYRGLR